jgi:hypothetical protein
MVDAEAAPVWPWRPMRATLVRNAHERPKGGAG